MAKQSLPRLVRCPHSWAPATQPSHRAVCCTHYCGVLAGWVSAAGVSCGWGSVTGCNGQGGEVKERVLIKRWYSMWWELIDDVCQKEHIKLTHIIGTIGISTLLPRTDAISTSPLPGASTPAWAPPWQGRMGPPPSQAPPLWARAAEVLGYRMGRTSDENCRTQMLTNICQRTREEELGARAWRKPQYDYLCALCNEFTVKAATGKIRQRKTFYQGKQVTPGQNH